MDAEKLSPEVENIFDTCVRVFLLKGYETSTMEDIAEACSISPEALKGYYATKHDLTFAALRWYYLKFSRHVRDEMAMHSDLYAAMEAVLFAFIEICSDQIHANKGLFLRTFVDISYVDDEVKKEFEVLEADWQGQMLNKFRQCQSELKNPADVEILAYYVRTVIEGFYEMVKFNTPDEVMYQLARVSLEVVESRMKTAPPPEQKRIFDRP
ncbi:TetR/AcrR family transcriptional regulator [Pseudovibrio sp. JE062]|uniref:TetR/AcrR family transcriptional regulator n=1 Tax=Pseudovibrio sp. JE062 TaxID=439495 RepID=UPI000186C35D|nr:TetR/AcrR family transcriptional regulator [Pseudovibrio sp. JE062]EEA92688.1 putative transcriptional regulator, TerR family [Pseudovibrio sp. JE062]